MNQKVIFNDYIDERVMIKKHGNTEFCNPNMLEINPTVGCQFQCQYCNAYTQEKEDKFDEVIVYKNYPKYLEQYILDNREEVKNKFFYFSPKVDAFQQVLIDTGILKQILEIFLKYQVKYFILTKGKLLPPDIAELLVKSREINQIIISCAMPNETVRQKLEVCAPTIEERLALAKFATDNGIVTTAIFAPILPIKNLDFVKDYIVKYLAMGITHFRVDFTEVSRESLGKIVKILPEYKEELEKIYYDKDAVQTKWNIPFSDPPKFITRYWPSLTYMRQVCCNMESFATSINPKATISICNSISIMRMLGNVNKKANECGFCCIGARFK